jgi:hypothetical protein
MCVYVYSLYLVRDFHSYLFELFREQQGLIPVIHCPGTYTLNHAPI